MRRSLLCLAVVAVLACLFISAAKAWWVIGHASITEAAASVLPDEMPAFFRASGKSLGHLAGDPDRWKNREATFLRNSESPHHFLDMEDLEGNEIPRDRFTALALMNKLSRPPDKIGLLPWAIMEGFDRLTVAFYDYRQEPSNPAVTMKCIVYAGTLAHYTTDASMPLHTTRNYDGKPGPDGKMVQKGIHAKIDGFPEKNKFTPEEICRGLEARRVDDMFDYMVKFIKESHTHIDKCYELDLAKAFDSPTDESRAFIMARCRAGAQFTMDVWYNAWLKSAKIGPAF
jgi:hypothetical protein